MFSQSIIDKMSIADKIKTIKSLTYSIDNNIQDQAQDALDYLNSLIVVAESLQQDIECYLED